MNSEQTKIALRELGVRLANVRANPRGGHGNVFDKKEAEHPIQTARAVLGRLEVRCVDEAVVPIAVWTEEHRLALQILMLATAHMVGVE